MSETVEETTDVGPGKAQDDDDDASVSATAVKNLVKKENPDEDALMVALTKTCTRFGLTATPCFNADEQVNGPTKCTMFILQIAIVVVAFDCRTRSG